MKFFRLSLLAAAAALIGAGSAQAQRTFSSQTIILDDGTNTGHTMTLQTPSPGDPGYASWTGNLTWKLPIPPSGNPIAGFIFPGTAANQIPVWVLPSGGAPQGDWAASSFTTGVLHATTGAGITSSVVSLTADVGATILPVANGGTNANNAGSARTNLGAAALGANSDITSLTALSTPLAIAEGGTNSGVALAGNTLMRSTASGIVEGPAWNNGTSTLTANITGNISGTANGLTAAGWASPGTIGSTAANTGAFTALTSTGPTSLGATTAASLNTTPIGATTASTGAFTTLTSTGATNINAAGNATTNVGTGTGNTNLGNASGSTLINGNAVGINAANNNTTSLGTGTGFTNLGNATAITTINGNSVNINTTNSNTTFVGTGTGNTGIGNVSASTAINGSALTLNGANPNLTQVGTGTGTTFVGNSTGGTTITGNTWSINSSGQAVFSTATIGGGAPILKVISATAALDFPSTATQTSNDLTITLTGAALGDVVILGVPNAAVPAAATCYTAWVSAANTVTVRFNNYSTTTYDPASATFRVAIAQF